MQACEQKPTYSTFRGNEQPVIQRHQSLTVWRVFGYQTRVYHRQLFATVLYKTAQQVGKTKIAMEVREQEGAEDIGRCCKGRDSR